MFFTSVALYFTAICAAPAQHYRHATAWGRLNVIGGVTSKVSVLGEFFYRTQNDMRLSQYNPIQAPLLQGARVGLNYRFNQHWSVYVSPFWYLNSHALLGKDADYERAPVPEIRYALAPEWRYDWKKTTLQLRWMQEYRTFGAAAPVAHRARFRVQGRYQFNKQNYILASDELFYIIPSLKVAPVFDIHRPLVCYGHNFNAHLALEVGYQFNYKRRRTLVEFDEEHSILLTAFIRLGH